ncbi:amidohydrolase [Sorangium cellulosum]|uniref:Amidohydrolase n=1 Tax=Sorangium cellulosum TaxID=56 RepID=A0A2L0F8A6_SORCE|nr:amidohydrolase family protein [Sorangium cellulosum]AUX47816.1 amidohydrolase [Sorangium cellulosum]
MEYADTLITHAHALTMRGDGVGYLGDGALAVKGGRIAAVGTTAELSSRFQARETIDATGHAMLPGLIDAHLHSPVNVIRGVAQDVDGWLEKAFWTYYKHVDDADALARSRFTILEGIKGGITTFLDHVAPFPGWPQAFADAGVRGRLAASITALGMDAALDAKRDGLYPLDPEVGGDTEETVAFAREWNGAAGGRITTLLGPVAPDVVLREHLVAIKREAERAGLMIHMHVAQGDREIAQMLARHGKRTPAYLDELGYLDDQLMAVHLTEATREETELMARRGVRMVLCSSAIGLIDGIVPPALSFKEAGGLVALGSDNSACSMFNEMRLTALFNKIARRDPKVMPPWEVLRMATIESARAIGLGDEIGSLEVGKQADLILVDLRDPSLSPVLEAPVRNIAPNLVYFARGSEVRTVMVAGRLVMRDGRVLTMDERAVLEEAQASAEAIARRVVADPAHEDLALVAATRSGKL